MVGADEQIVEIALGHGAVVTAVLKQEVGKSRTHHAVLVPVGVLSDEILHASIEHLGDFRLKAHVAGF